MKRIRYTMPARSQGKLYMQRAMACTVKALIKATGLNPHLSVCGWPFCLDDVDGVDDMEGGAM